VRLIIIALVALLALAGASGYWMSVRPTVTVTPLEVTDDVLARGEYLLYAGGCVSCHSHEDDPAQALSGGRALDTPFGTFYAPNITPDLDAGIGAWSDEDFIRAFRYGVSPSGQHYYPAFPYTAYTGMTDADLLALKAYLFSLAPVDRPNREHELAWYVSRPLLTGWKWLHFDSGVFKPDSTRLPQWNQGAYLVRHLGHCAECHTPRTWTGGLRQDRTMAGNPEGPEGEAVPNITPHPEGIGDWMEYDLVLMLELGMLPDGDFVGGSMTAVIDDNTSRLTEADRQAIAMYLLSLPPLPAE